MFSLKNPFTVKTIDTNNELITLELKKSGTEYIGNYNETLEVMFKELINMICDKKLKNKSYDN